MHEPPFQAVNLPAINNFEASSLLRQSPKVVNQI